MKPANLLTLVFVLSVNLAHAQQSTFETGLEGWTHIGSGLLEHDNRDGGNPGGYARFEDAPGPGGDGWLIAPARFLGDWTRLDNIGELSWDHRVVSAGDVGNYVFAQAYIAGPGGSAMYTSSQLLGHGWRSYSAPITRSAWVVSGDWSALLHNVTELRIRIEGVHNNGPQLDIDGIDNVGLAPRFDPGDVNCDGEVNAFDIEPFLTALFDPEGYAAQYPDCDISYADINGDGSIDAFDIEPFLAILFP